MLELLQAFVRYLYEPTDKQMEPNMTTDVFIAGLIGMAIFTLVIMVLCHAQDTFCKKTTAKDDRSSLPPEDRR